MIDIPVHLLSENCPQCQKPLDDCVCVVIEQKLFKDTFKPVVLLDRKKRKGKTVTLITNLPSDEAYLKKLAKMLKSKTGSGGTFYTEDKKGIIEVQGNHLELFKNLILNEN